MSAHMVVCVCVYWFMFYSSLSQFSEFRPIKAFLTIKDYKGLVCAHKQANLKDKVLNECLNRL